VSANRPQPLPYPLQFMVILSTCHFNFCACKSSQF
jgi:hypothetical protein